MSAPRQRHGIQTLSTSIPNTEGITSPRDSIDRSGQHLLKGIHVLPLIGLP